MNCILMGLQVKKKKKEKTLWVLFFWSFNKEVIDLEGLFIGIAFKVVLKNCCSNLQLIKHVIHMIINAVVGLVLFFVFF